MKYLILNGLSLVIKSNVSLGGTTARNKLPLRLEKTFKEVVFSQKIWDCSGSRMDTSFLSTFNS